MTAMQRQVQSSSLFSDDEDCFDMWHDYMKLGQLLVRLRGIRDEGDQDHHHHHHGGAEEGPKAEAAAAAPAPWGHMLQSPRPEDCRNSVETSSLSSLSDNSSSGTSSDFCRFCKQNGESARVYRSHKLKSEEGKVICPILWNYTCPICEATGDHAHTRRYCPEAQRQDAARMLRGSRRLR